MSRFLHALLPAALLLIAWITPNAHAQAIVFSNHNFNPTGQASLAILPGPPPVLESTFQGIGDAVSMDIGGSGGGFEWQELAAPALWGDGPVFSLEAVGDLAVLQDQTLVRVELGSTAGSAEIVADFPGMGSPAFQVETYASGQLVAAYQNPGTILADVFPTGFRVFRSVVPAYAPDLTCVEGPALAPALGFELTFPPGALVSVGSGKEPDIVETILMLVALGSGGDPEIADRLTMTLFRAEHTGLAGLFLGAGTTQLPGGSVHGLGEGLIEGSGDNLVVQNLGECAQDGIRVEVDDDETQNLIGIEELVLKRGGASCIDVALMGYLGGGPFEEQLGLAQVVDNGIQLDIDIDYSYMGVESRAFYLNDGQVVAIPAAGTPIEILQRKMPTGVGGVYLDESNFGHRFTWENDVVAAAPFIHTVLIDEIRVVATQPTPAYTVTATEFYFGGTGDVDDVVILEGGAKGVRAPANSDWSRIGTLGQSYVQRGGGDLVVVRNSGSSGNDGFFIPLTASEVRQQMRWGSYGSVADQDPNAQIVFSAIGAPVGLPTPRSVGRVTLANANPNTTILADFTTMNSSAATVAVYSDGNLVGMETGLPFGPVATVGPGGVPCTVAVDESFFSFAPLGYKFFITDETTVTIEGSKRAFVGDEIHVLAEDPVAPLQDVFEWRVELTDIPNFFITEISSGQVTAVTPQVRTPVALTVAPNPFNPRTSVSFDLLRGSDVAVRVYAINGRYVDTLHQGWLPAGRQMIAWDGTDRAGKSVASGVYLLRMDSDAGVSTARAALLK